MKSTGRWAAAVDLDAQRVPAPVDRGFAAGVGAGVLAFAVAAQLALALHVDVLAMFLPEDDELRTLSRLAMSPLWRYGLPLGFATALVVLWRLRVRAAAVWATVGGVAVTALVLTYVWTLAALA